MMVYAFSLIDPKVMRWPYISWLDLNCVCSVFSLVSLLFHLLIIVVLAVLIKKRRLSLFGSIFGWILIGLIVSGLAEFLDFYHNLLVAKAGKMIFYPQLDVVQEIIKGLGLTIVFISLLRGLKGSVHL